MIDLNDARTGARAPAPDVLLAAFAAALTLVACAAQQDPPATDPAASDAGCVMGECAPEEEERIVFTRMLGAEQVLFVAAADGTGERKLTDGPHDSSPAWSPDGRRIAFVRFGADAVGSSVLTIAADGSDLRTLISSDELRAQLADGSGLGGLTWSPDGARVAFHAIDLWVPSLFSVSTDAAPARLTRLAQRGASPAWSPDGARLVYACNCADGVRVLRSGEAGSSLLVASTTASDPAWSPDGERIAFADGGDLDTIGADGSGLTRRTTLESADVVGPTFFRDGRRIAFTHRTAEEQQVVVLDLATDTVTPLIEDAAEPDLWP